MPLLDVSLVLVDPMLADNFDVLRRKQLLSSKGNVSTLDTLIRDRIGVICAASSSDLRRFDDLDLTERHLSIVTSYRLRATSPGYKPDLIRWCGDWFIVKTVEPYPRYGKGQLQVIAGSIDPQDLPAPGAPRVVGTMDFTIIGNPLLGTLQ